MWLFITELFVVVPNWPQPKHASAGEGIDTLWYIHTMENHLAIKEKEAQMHAATQMNYKCIVLMSDTKD